MKACLLNTNTVQQTTPPGVNTTDVGQLSTGFTMLDSIDTRNSARTNWAHVLHEQFQHVLDQLHLQHPIFS